VHGVSVLGCGDVSVDEERMQVTRSGDDFMYVECLDSHVVHTLVCRHTQWIGQFNCSLHTGIIVLTINLRSTVIIIATWSTEHARTEKDMNMLTYY